MTLCRACTDERNRWLDTKPSTLIPRFSITHGSGAPYDASPTGVRDNTRARYEQWRRTVNSQRDLIARTCREQGHTTWVQTDLLTQLAEEAA